MGVHVARQALQILVKKGIKILGTKVNLLGLTFKENCPDIRNTRVLDIYRELTQYGIDVDICDPVANTEEILEEYGKVPTDFDKLNPGEALILAVPHDILKENLKTNLFRLMKVPYAFIDVKGVFEADIFQKEERGVYWRL